MSEGKSSDLEYESKFEEKFDEGGAASAAASRNSGDNEMTDSDLEAEAEWEALKNAPQEGECAVSDDPRARKILAGFKINFMKMRDANTGELKWLVAMLASHTLPNGSPLFCTNVKDDKKRVLRD